MLLSVTRDWPTSSFSRHLLFWTRDACCSPEVQFSIKGAFEDVQEKEEGRDRSAALVYGDSEKRLERGGDGKRKSPEDDEESARVERGTCRREHRARSAQDPRGRGDGGDDGEAEKQRYVRSKRGGSEKVTARRDGQRRASGVGEGACRASRSVQRRVVTRGSGREDVSGGVRLPRKPRGVDGAHAEVGSTLGVSDDGSVHGQSSVEDDVAQRLDRHDVRDRGEGGVLSERVSSKRRLGLDESLAVEVGEGGLRDGNKRNLGAGGGDKLGCESAEGEDCREDERQLTTA